jgi:hypothetical protein
MFYLLVVTMEEGRCDFKMFIVTGNIPLGRPRRTMDLKERGIDTKNWTDSAQDRNYWITGFRPP